MRMNQVGATPVDRRRSRPDIPVVRRVFVARFVAIVIAVPGVMRAEGPPPEALTLREAVLRAVGRLAPR